MFERMFTIFCCSFISKEIGIFISLSSEEVIPDIVTVCLILYILPLEFESVETQYLYWDNFSSLELITSHISLLKVAYIQDVYPLTIIEIKEKIDTEQEIRLLNLD